MPENTDKSNEFAFLSDTIDPPPEKYAIEKLVFLT